MVVFIHGYRALIWDTEWLKEAMSRTEQVIVAQGDTYVTFGANAS